MLQLRFPIIFLALACAPLLPSHVSAATIVTAGGDSGTSLPLGYYAGLAPNYTPTVFAVSWTQTASYQNVTVAATLFDSDYIPSGNPAYLGGYVDYTLINAIGPGTSFAANGIARGSVFIGDSIQSYTLLTLPSLAAGQYYLVLDAPGGTGSLSLLYNSICGGCPPAPTPVTGTGVTFDGDFWSNATARDVTYTPASIFSGTSVSGEFSVTGTPTATAAPEPAYWPLALIAMVLFASVKKGSQKVDGAEFEAALRG